MLCNCKNGVSSWEFHRAIGVAQETTWFMLHRIRLAGKVEVSGTFIGGKLRNMRASKRAAKITGTGVRTRPLSWV